MGQACENVRARKGSLGVGVGVAWGLRVEEEADEVGVDGEEEMVIDLDPPKSVFTTRVCVCACVWGSEDEGAKRDGVGVVDDDDDVDVEADMFEFRSEEEEEEEEGGRGIEIGWYGEEDPS